MKTEQTLHDKFWQTRLEAKAAYKAWQASIGKTALVREGELLNEYHKAWEAHMVANFAQFVEECES